MAKLAKQLGSEMEFLGINVGINEKGEAAVREYAEKNKLGFPMVFDQDRAITKSFGVMGTPTHIIIGRKGTVRYLGADAPEDLEKHMQGLLD